MTTIAMRHAADRRLPMWALAIILLAALAASVAACHATSDPDVGGLARLREPGVRRGRTRARRRLTPAARTVAPPAQWVAGPGVRFPGRARTAHTVRSHPTTYGGDHHDHDHNR